MDTLSVELAKPMGLRLAANTLIDGIRNLGITLVRSAFLATYSRCSLLDSFLFEIRLTCAHLRFSV